ncbi:hypothetical protein Nepgr_027746 [Nepenthes gracilis]|uniref:Uncharacterized protein n=1 Tax=Nepenthes gracilis TaxID=150966 RepID=A0AAD3Y1P6_NEPGR|nr:hypothetical protein Nepgr_027746 [Nepenthes gracilis]
MVGLKIPWAEFRMMVETSVAVFRSGPLLNAAAEAVALFGTALECSAEQLSCFLGPFADLGWAAGLTRCNGSMIAASCWWSAYPVVRPGAFAGAEVVVPCWS